MRTRFKKTLNGIKANPIIWGFIISTIASLISWFFNFDIADWFNLTAKTSDKCNYLAKEQLIIKTQNINKSQNLTTIIDINNNCNSLDADKQIIAKRDLTKLQDYIAIFATFFVATAVFIIENQKHQLKSLDKIIIYRSFKFFAIELIFSLILFLCLFYNSTNIMVSNVIIVVFIFHTPLVLFYLYSFYNRTRDQTKFISILKAPEEVNDVWKELLQPKTINKLSIQEIDSLLQNSFVKHCKILDSKYDYSWKEGLRSFLINDKVMDRLIDCRPNFVAIMNFYEYEKDTYFKYHYRELLNAAFAKNEQQSLNLLRALRGWLEKEKKDLLKFPLEEKKDLLKFPLEVSEHYFDELLNYDKLEKNALKFFIPKISEGGIYFLSITKSLKTRLWLDIANQDYAYENFIPKLKFFCQDSFLTMTILISLYKSPEKLSLYTRDDECATYKKFFMIFYEVFFKIHSVSVGENIEGTRQTLKNKIDNSTNKAIIDNLIFFNLMRDLFQWQKSLLEKEGHNFNYLSKELEKALKIKKTSKHHSKLMPIYKAMYYLKLCYEPKNYHQIYFIDSFQEYSDEIFGYYKEVYAEGTNERKEIESYDEYKNILFPPQI